jgi:hypothetical protein
MLLTLLTIT